MNRTKVVLCWIGLFVPVCFTLWALWEEMVADDRYKIAWQSYWMDRSDEVMEPGAEEQFLAAHPGIERNRVPIILFVGGLSTFTWYFAVLGPGVMAQWRMRRANPHP